MAVFLCMQCCYTIQVNGVATLHAQENSHLHKISSTSFLESESRGGTNTTTADHVQTGMLHILQTVVHCILYKHQYSNTLAAVTWTAFFKLQQIITVLAVRNVGVSVWLRKDMFIENKTVINDVMMIFWLKTFFFPLLFKEGRVFWKGKHGRKNKK